MNQPGTTGHKLQIRRLRAHYLVSTHHPAPERVKARLDEALSVELVGTLATALERIFPASDSTVLLIRRLEIALHVNVAWEDDNLVRYLAGQIVRSLDSIRQEPDNENSARFVSWAEYLGRFLVDLAQGRAWSKWYYESFDGLRMLPTSAALRTAICDKPAIGRAALLQLSTQELGHLCTALTRQDTRQILERFSSDGQTQEEERCLQALWAAWQSAEPGVLQATEEWQNVLRLYIAVSRTHPDLGGQTLTATALALLRLARALLTDTAEQSRTLLALLTSGDLAALHRTMGARDAETFLPLLYCSPGLVEVVAQELLSRYGGPQASQSVEAMRERHTPFGSLFLLFPFLDELPLEAATRDWPGLDDVPTATIARFLLSIKCCGQAHAQQAFFDPLVRDLLTIPPSLSPDTLRRWQAGISERKLSTFLEEVARWQEASGACTGQALALIPSALPGSAVAVLLDCQRGVWLTALSYRRRAIASLIERCSRWFSWENRQPPLLFSAEPLVTVLRSAFPSLQIAERAGAITDEQVQESSTLQETLARLDHVPSDLAYLALPSSFRFARAFDLALSVAAQALLRAFAWRLPGFARSSLPYLARNFLAVAASVEDEPARRVVRLGRPPLHIILGITGMARKTYRLSWLDERPFTLFEQG